MDSGPLARPPKPPFDRERFIFKILAAVIGTQLLIYSLSLAAGVCPATLEQLQGGFDSTLKLLLALAAGTTVAVERLRQNLG
jgi:hypothetical protein